MGVYIVFSAICAACTGFLFGYDIGSINGVKDMVGYRRTLNLSYNLEDRGGGNSSQSCSFEDDIETSVILGLLVSLMSTGGLMGALIGGLVSDYFGRKPVIILGAALYTVGGALHTGAFNLGMVLLARILFGIGAGIVYQVTPIYIGEIAPERLRGRLLSFINISSTFGYTLGIVMNIVVGDLEYGWRLSVGVEAVTGTILFTCLLFTPRSPRWLVTHRRSSEALKVVNKMYVARRDMDRCMADMTQSASQKQSLYTTLKYVLQWNMSQRVLLGFMIFLLGRLTGGSFIAYFSVTVLCKIGLPGFTVSLALAGSVFIPMALSLFIIDKLGRKPLFLCGLSGMFAMLAISAALIQWFRLDSAAPEDINIVAVYSTLVLLCINQAGFALTCGNVPWIIMGELFPLPAKGVVISICNTAYWLGTIISSQVGPILISSPLSVSGTLLLFSADIFVLFLIILFFLPETKAITLENLEKLYSKPWKDRVNVLYYLKCCCFREMCRIFDSTKKDPLDLVGVSVDVSHWYPVTRKNKDLQE